MCRINVNSFFREWRSDRDAATRERKVSVGDAGQVQARARPRGIDGASAYGQLICYVSLSLDYIITNAMGRKVHLFCNSGFFLTHLFFGMTTP
jgi:hypothetical protein